LPVTSNGPPHNCATAKVTPRIHTSPGPAQTPHAQPQPAAAATTHPNPRSGPNYGTKFFSPPSKIQIRSALKNVQTQAEIFVPHLQPTADVVSHGYGLLIHCCVEVTELSTNKQHTLSIMSMEYHDFGQRTSSSSSPPPSPSPFSLAIARFLSPSSPENSARASNAQNVLETSRKIKKCTSGARVCSPRCQTGLRCSNFLS
jgi:hypothetical protein